MNIPDVTKTIFTEYRHGFNSGMHHDRNDLLCRQNEEKMRMGMESNYPLIKAYWTGYYIAANGLPHDVRYVSCSENVCH